MSKGLFIVLAVFMFLTISLPRKLYSQSFKAPHSFDVGLSYTGDLFGNAAGGNKAGVRYLDNIYATLSIDLNALIGLAHTSVFIEGLGNQGGSISSLTGGVQGVDNIEAPTSWRLYTAWVQHIFPKAKMSVLVGKYDLNTEFDVISTAQLFINSSQGIGAEYGLSGVIGPSTFPYTSLGLRLKMSPAQGFLIKAAVFDGVPSDPENPRGTKIYFHKTDGALIAAELNYSPDFHRSDTSQKSFLEHGVETLHTYHFTLGGWLYTEPRMGWLSSHQRGQGIYASIDAKLFKEKNHPKQGLSGYVRIGLANGKINQFSGYTGGGVVYTGLIKGRNDDQFGLAIAIAWNSSDYQTVAKRQNMLPANNETDLEGTYLFVISTALQFQLDLQYIIHPNTVNSIDNAFVAGGRIILSF
jgi:porin